ncbi:hemolysin XhlA family protein [Paenibacillus elgii]|uniref:hemolysin XhlA family protein n=1 Tax=Paenibacillus elgii TaxID=189691 RepID=UPI0013D45042|nr:hemolysin XhlA family protein [Paenibacillus elgii]
MDDIEKISEQITTVRLDIRELSTKIEGLKDLTKKVDDVEDIAKKALGSAEMAHHRLERIDKLTFWLATTVIGAIILAIIGYALRGGFNTKM